ncbi:hypothetical protein [Marinobacter sp. LV10MA510-1]|uniref:hypothetical protein n=1 Tax=Marinobacter sp. LV10MA510-1 TaxID=1415567 RepID=UPI000BF47542|nr:hypothetical protein [Marinobacter sp. LV10MA510-1]PFG07899.1 hypothetical protein ATI45_0108 [Marinobacter sp. LV10MA510-1]
MKPNQALHIVILLVLAFGAGPAHSGEVSVIPPTAIITPPMTINPPTIVILPVSPPSAAAALQRLQAVIAAFPLSAMSTQGLQQAANLVTQAQAAGTLTPAEQSALADLANNIQDELSGR